MRLLRNRLRMRLLSNYRSVTVGRGMRRPAVTDPAEPPNLGQPITQYVMHKTGATLSCSAAWPDRLESFIGSLDRSSVSYS